MGGAKTYEPQGPRGNPNGGFSRAAPPLLKKKQEGRKDGDGRGGKEGRLEERGIMDPRNL